MRFKQCESECDIFIAWSTTNDEHRIGGRQRPSNRHRRHLRWAMSRTQLEHLFVWCSSRGRDLLITFLAFVQFKQKIRIYECIELCFYILWSISMWYLTYILFCIWWALEHPDECRDSSFSTTKYMTGVWKLKALKSFKALGSRHIQLHEPSEWPAR